MTERVIGVSLAGLLAFTIWALTQVSTPVHADNGFTQSQIASVVQSLKTIAQNSNQCRTTSK